MSNEAEESEELKKALSSQMVQLLLEQEQRLEGYLRECITFDGGVPTKEREKEHFPGRVKFRSKSKYEYESGSDEVGGIRGRSISPENSDSDSSSNSSVRVSRDELGSVSGVGNVGGVSPISGRTPDLKGDVDVDDFEKVESWMAECSDGGEGTGNDRGQVKAREGSLLVPFPSSFS